jgi:hypothetical protein
MGITYKYKKSKSKSKSRPSTRKNKRKHIKKQNKKIKDKLFYGGFFGYNPNYLNTQYLQDKGLK